MENNLTEQKTKKLKTYRWLVWGILCAVYVIVFFHRLAVGVVKSDLIEAFHISATTFANLGSAYFYAYLLMQVPTGMLADTLGARVTVAAGTVLAGVGSILFGFSPTISTAFAGRLLVGLGVSVVFISILKIQTEWFAEKEFATMSGLTVFFGNMGGVLAQTPLVILVSVLTWRYSFAIIGFITCLMAGLCFLIVKNRPADMGLPSIQEIEGKRAGAEIKSKSAETGIESKRTEAEIESKRTRTTLQALWRICRNRYIWPPFLMFAGFYGAFQALSGTWGHSYLMTVYGMNEVAAANYMAVAVLGFCAASVLIGKISDRLGRRRLPTIVFGTVYLFSWAFLVFYNGGKPPVEALGILFFILGFAGAAFVLGWACGKEVNDPKYAGISMSVVNTGGFLGAAVVPVMVGRVIDKYGNLVSPQQLYGKAFLLCFICVSISYVFIFLIKETGCRNIYKAGD